MVVVGGAAVVVVVAGACVVVVTGTLVVVVVGATVVVVEVLVVGGRPGGRVVVVVVVGLVVVVVGLVVVGLVVVVVGLVVVGLVGLGLASNVELAGRSTRAFNGLLVRLRVLEVDAGVNGRAGVTVDAAGLGAVVLVVVEDAPLSAPPVVEGDGAAVATGAVVRPPPEPFWKWT